MSDVCQSHLPTSMILPTWFRRYQVTDMVSPLPSYRHGFAATRLPTWCRCYLLGSNARYPQFSLRNSHISLTSDWLFATYVIFIWFWSFQSSSLIRATSCRFQTLTSTQHKLVSFDLLRSGLTSLERGTCWPQSPLWAWPWFRSQRPFCPCHRPLVTLLHHPQPARNGGQMCGSSGSWR